MAQTLHAFTCHLDATRFEIEDVLVRQTAASLVSEETPLESVTVDVGVQVRSTPGPDAHGFESLHALMWLTGATDEATKPTQLDSLVAEAAIPMSAWSIATHEISELSQPWVGQATPGPKISIVFNRTTADSPDYRAELAALAQEVAALLGDVGCRIATTDDSTCPFEAAIIFWFVNPEAAAQAFRTNGFDRVITSPLVDRDSVVVLEMIEHRIAPNPNNWSTTTGIQPPKV